MNYTTCTVEELANHVEVSTCQAVTQQLTYHKKRGHLEIVEKVAAARKIVKKRKLLKMLEALS